MSDQPSQTERWQPPPVSPEDLEVLRFASWFFPEEPFGIFMLCAPPGQGH